MQIKRTLLPLSLLLCTSLQAQTYTPSPFAKEQASSSMQLLYGGSVPGVWSTSGDGNPEGNMNIYVRGLNSLRGNTSPLWIIDGIEIGEEVLSHQDIFYQYPDKSYTVNSNPVSFLSALDIESIEVIANSSATAIYGSKGANGVIIVRTRRPDAQEKSEIVSSAGVSFPEYSSDSFRPAIVHNHVLSLNGSTKGNDYALSANFRQAQGIVRGTDAVRGGIRLAFDNHSSDRIAFGMNVLASLSESMNTSSTAYPGQPSFMAILRAPWYFGSDSVQGWEEDYDDKLRERRASGSMHLDIRLLRSLVWKNAVSFDLRNTMRGLWYGNGTSFGYENNGAAGRLSTEIFHNNFSSALQYSRFFAKHRVDVSASFEQFLTDTHYAAMNGLDFFSHELRETGINLASIPSGIHAYDYVLSQRAVTFLAEYGWNSLAGVRAAARAEFTPRYYDSKAVWYPSAEVWADLRGLFGIESGAVSSLRLEGGWGIAGKVSMLPFDSRLSVDAQPWHEALASLRTEGWNASLTASFLDSRINAEVSLYGRHTDDGVTRWCFGEIGEKDLWDKGKRYIYEDYSSRIQTKGVEFSFSAVPVKTKDVRLEIGATGSFGRSEVESAATPDGVCPEVGSRLSVGRNIPGEAVGAFYGYHSSDLTEGVLGNPFPAFTGGVFTNLQAGRWSAELRLDAATGFQIVDLTELTVRQYKPYTLTDEYVKDADYLRIACAGIGYSLGRLTMRLSASNIPLWTKYSGWNPSVNSYSSIPGVMGTDYGSFPQVMTVMIGAGFQF